MVVLIVAITGAIGLYVTFMVAPHSVTTILGPVAPTNSKWSPFGPSPVGR